MSVDEVDIFEIEALKASVHSLDNVLAGQTLVVDNIVAKGTSPVDLLRIQMSVSDSSVARPLPVCAPW